MDIEKMSDDEIIKYLQTRNSKVLSPVLKQLKINNIEEHMNHKKIYVSCPDCNSQNKMKNGTNDSGSQRYKCKDCGRGYTATTNTIFDGTDYSWDEMVNIIKDLINDTNIEYTAKNLRQGEEIKLSTIWNIRHRILEIMARMPLPRLSGVIQIDEKYFRESQKGSRSLVNMVEPTKTRRKRRNYQASKAGIFGPEFVNVLCAVDSYGHWWAKPVCLGPMTMNEINDLGNYIDEVAYICTDALSIYSFWCKEKKWKHYIEPSNYRKERQARGYIDTYDMYHTLTPEEYEKDRKINKQLYEDGIYPHIETERKLSYDELVAIRSKFNLGLNGVNSFHNVLEGNWNREKVGSTDYITHLVAKEVYLHNFRLYRHMSSSNFNYNEAEEILCELIKFTLINKNVPTSKDIENLTFMDLPRPSNKAIKDAISGMSNFRKVAVKPTRSDYKDYSAYEGTENSANFEFMFNKYKFFNSISTERRNELIHNNGLYRKGMLKAEKVQLLSQLPNAQDIIFYEIYLQNYGSEEEFKKAMEKIPQKRKRKKKTKD